MKLLVFLPCLNEEETLSNVIGEIPRLIAGVSAVDVLVVDDGSRDRSSEIARQAGATVLRNKTNMGVGFSFQRAVKYALDQKYDFLCNIDADGQFNPADIPSVVKPLLDGDADFVSGSRFLESKAIENMSFVKRWGNDRMSSLVNMLSKQTFTDVSCGFRAYSREALMRLNLQGQFTYTQEVFLNLAFQRVRIAEVPIVVRYFKGRQSRVAGNIVSYAVKTSKIIFRTYRDYKPLRFFSSIALGFFILGLSFLSILFGWYIHSGGFTPHIWSGFVGAAFCFCSLIFFVLGLLADMQTRLRSGQEELLYLLRKKG